MKKTLINDLLTENRYWTFWSSDWTVRVNVFWEGKTKWKDVVSAVRVKMNKVKGEEVGYERQVQLRNPDLSFS